MKILFCLGVLLICSSCYSPERNCALFHEGSFEFSTILENKEQTTRFTRIGDLEISSFNGVTDSASVRWINSCEYILTNLHPKSKAEEKPIHIKILSTSSDSYTFEYKLVGTSKAERGTAVKIN